MRKLITRIGTTVFVAAVICSLAVGCRSTGRKRTTKTESSLASTENRMESAKAQVDTTLEAMDGLRDKSGRDLERQYALFKKEVGRMESMADAARGQARAMKAGAEIYFAAWEQGAAELNDEELQRFAAERREEIRRKYQSLLSAMTELGEACNPFILDLVNVVRFLDLDLTPVSVRMLGDRISKARQDGDAVREKIDSVQAELNSLAAGISTSGPTHGEAAESRPGVKILRSWSGNYPVSELDRLPQGQREDTAGFISDATTFASVWEAFEPGAEGAEEGVPDVDFEKNIVVFTRNTQFYNRTNITNIDLKDGVAEIVAMETRSAMPIEEKVAMALAEVPREGIRSIRSGEEQVPVQP